MENWIYTLLFIFSTLVVGRNIFLVIIKLFSAEPASYKLTTKELVLLGIAISFILTYLIY